MRHSLLAILVKCLFPLVLAGSVCCAMAQELPQVFVERGLEGGAHAVAISPDFRYLASADGSNVILWDFETGRELRRVRWLCEGLAFSNDGTMLITSWHVAPMPPLWSRDEGYLIGLSVPALKQVRTFSTQGIDRIAVSSRDGSLFGLSLSNEVATLSLWNVATGSNVRAVQIPMQYLPNWVAVVEGGRYVTWVDVTTHTLSFYDSATLHRAFPSERGWANANFEASVLEMLSSEGRFMVTRKNTGETWADSVRDVITGKTVLPAITCNPVSSAFSADSQFLAEGCQDGSADLYSVESGSFRRSFGAHVSEPKNQVFSQDSLALSRDGTLLFTGNQLWDMTSISVARTFPSSNPTGRFVDDLARISFDGRYGLTFHGKTFTLWDLGGNSGKRDFSLDLIGDRNFEAQFTPDGSSLLLTVAPPQSAKGGTYNTVLVNLQDGSIVRTYPEIASFNVAISPDQKYIAGIGHEGKLTVWLFATGKVVREFPKENGDTSYHPYFTPDSEGLVVGVREQQQTFGNTRLSKWDITTGTLQFTFRKPHGIGGAAISPDGRTIVAEHVFSNRGGLQVIDARTGDDLRRISTDHDWSPTFLADPRLCLSMGIDKIMRIWNIGTGEELLRLVGFQDGEWITITPQGYYKASAKGDRYLSVRFGDRVYGIDQWRRTLNQPRIVETALRTGSAREAIASVLGNAPAIDLTAGSVAEPPAIEFRSPTNGATVSSASPEIAFTVTDNQRSVQSVSVFVNGRKAVDSGDSGANAGSGVTRLAIPPGQRHLDLAAPVRLDPGKNRIEVSAFNGIAEARKTLELNFPEQPREDVTILPNLWILAIGVNHYQNTGFPSLTYAEDDARGVADAFANQKGRVFREVHTLLITDNGQVKPTSENIIDNLNYLKKAGQTDVVLLFVAGHGILDSSGEFYFLPSDAAFAEDGTVRRSRAVSWRDLKSVLDVPAKKIILLDACHSEGVTGRKTRGLISDEIVRDLQDTRGVIISSSRGKELSQESAEWRHGAFTYALLEGINGKADFLEKKRISMLALATYVSERVPELTGGAQHPIMDTPDGYQQFVIARLP